MEEEEEGEGEEKETAPAESELTDKDRLQQAKGVSNLIDDPKFNKTLEVLENSLLNIKILENRQIFSSWYCEREWK